MFRIFLALKSLLNRWFSCFLIILTLSASISLFFTVTRIQESVKNGFQNTVSGVDSIVAARGGNLQILLNSVFLIGEPSNKIQWKSYKDIEKMRGVKFMVPISLGDSHKGYRVIGTTNDYFKNIKFGNKKDIEFSANINNDVAFLDVFDVVIGSSVAKKLEYSLGSEIVVTHGLGESGVEHSFDALNADHDDHSDHGEHHDDHADHDDHSDHDSHDHGEHHDDHADHEDHSDHGEHHDDHADHDDHSDHDSHNHGDVGFKVTGILKPTGTPIDSGVYISVLAYEAIHKGWIGNQKVMDISEEHIKKELEPKSISAIFVSLKNRTGIFQFQRDILNYKDEALSSVMPGLTLSRLWALTSNIDMAFKIITAFIIFIALLGMTAMTIAGLNNRRREMAILRSVGASPRTIVSLMLIESLIISFISIFIGYVLMVLVFYYGQGYIENNYGIYVEGFSLKNYDINIIIAIVFSSLLATIIPAIGVYKSTLRDGLSVKS